MLSIDETDYLERKIRSLEQALGSCKRRLKDPYQTSIYC